MTTVPPGSGGGGGGGGYPFEARFAKIESDVEHIQKDVSEIRASKIGERLGVIEERLKHVPTTAKLLSIALGATIAVIVVLWSGIVFLGKPWIEQVVKSPPAGQTKSP